MKLDSKMENKTKTIDKDFSWLLGVEDEIEDESTLQEGLRFLKKISRTQRIPHTLNLHRTRRTQPFKGASVPR